MDTYFYSKNRIFFEYEAYEGDCAEHMTHVPSDEYDYEVYL